VISKYPIVGNTTHDIGVHVMLPGGRITVLNVHLNDKCYQPYQFLGIDYYPEDCANITTEAEAVDYSQRYRGKAVEQILQDMKVPPCLFPAPSCRAWLGCVACCSWKQLHGLGKVPGGVIEIGLPPAQHAGIQ
jgi:hypothetical protein